MHVKFKLKLVPVFLAIFAATHLSFAAIDSPEALDNARKSALDLIQDGNRLEAARLLLDSVSALQKDRADLALPAIGAVQLLMFTNEYLMTDEERQTLYSGSLDEKNNEMHRFMATLMRYMDDTGISQDEANKCALDLQDLVYCDNLPVRIGAQFTMSSPYYFYDTGLARQARDRIAKEFPDTFLAKEAQRLPLYYARTGGAKGLKEVLERTKDDGSPRPDTIKTRTDPVGAAIYDAVKNATPELADATCIAGLAMVARNTSDWAEEYAALNIAEGFHRGSNAAQVMSMANEVIERNRDPRCTFRARVIRMSIARTQSDTDILLTDADGLLDLEDIPWVPERNNYEELKNSIQQTADYLANSGRAAVARRQLEKLAGRFPHTVLATNLQQKAATISRESN